MGGSGGSGTSMLMNPAGAAGPMMDTMSDPQKMLAGFVGPTAAGIKPPPPKGPELAKPSTAMTPTSFGDLQSKYSVKGDAGGAGMDPQTLAFLQQLAGGRG